ncbi:hypothetical protein BCR33DRAFT_3301 [Rhizoclosmatium globosum]|uniref:G-protein coupled receptors family 1 profile domain-containing protein n=1 Tax=Rhizoclosmatium globosum TaxID=329046 RepID=A0A1Y2D2P4_9FUNG|nr:hypothetical protein BCR33DRAFT_3301 [Rhizoclosmatium globosum]|eukprot:ORY53569.1 hypothetical protein BCR33DRAFT_3301 [Rhizoclosmatium globosum]
MPIVNPYVLTNVTAGATLLPNGFTFQQTFILHIVAGLTIESSLYALFAVFTKSCHQTPQESRLLLAEAIISCCNISILCNMIADIMLLSPINDSVTCLSVQLYSNFFSHTIPFTFDAFILYRSWIISSRDKTCFVISMILAVGRLFCGLLDMFKSEGQWDEASMTCNFIQDSISLIVYSWLDILCDLFATVVAVTIIARHIGWDFADTNYMTVMSGKFLFEIQYRLTRIQSYDHLLLRQPI